MSEHQNLEGRVAVITGASRGLGRAMALALAARGAQLALVSRNKDLLEETASGCREAGGSAAVFPADVNSEAEVEKLAKEVASNLGNAHILVNNAGINVRKSVEDFTLAEWRSVIDTNLVAPFMVCRAFVPQLKENQWGRIINITSIMSHVSIAQRTAYSASKAGLLGMTKSLALELAPFGITVNGISPGPFATEMNLSIVNNPELNAQFVSKIPVGRWGKLNEVGELAAYLCSEEAGFITGTDVLIDGGWCAQ